MKSDTVFVFTHAGMGSGPVDLQQILAGKFLTLTLDSGDLPARILFYTGGVELACEGSPVLDQLQRFEAQGVELVLCKTCLEYFDLIGSVKVGIVGGMGDIIESMQKAQKVISL
jgi:hypothetical protein